VRTQRAHSPLQDHPAEHLLPGRPRRRGPRRRISPVERHAAGRGGHAAHSQRRGDQLQAGRGPGSESLKRRRRGTAASDGDGRGAGKGVEAPLEIWRYGQRLGNVILEARSVARQSFAVPVNDIVEQVEMLFTQLIELGNGTRSFTDPTNIDAFPGIDPAAYAAE